MSSSSIREASTESLVLLLDASRRAVEMSNVREVHPDVMSARWDRWTEVHDELDSRFQLIIPKPSAPFCPQDLVSRFNVTRNQH